MSKEENFKDIKTESIKIRDVLPEDAERIQEIYSPYVADTTISFEITVPDKSEMQIRIEKTLSNGFPYIVAENENGTVVGYAYADSFGEREAYRYSFIVSIYLDMKVQSRGIGQKLYDELEKRMKTMGIVQVVSAITGKNEKSLKFHEKNGFIKLVIFQILGTKWENGMTLYGWTKLLTVSKKLKAKKNKGMLK